MTEIQIIVLLLVVIAPVGFWGFKVITTLQARVKALEGRIFNQELWKENAEKRIGDIECDKLIDRANEVLQNEHL